MRLPLLGGAGQGQTLHTHCTATQINKPCAILARLFLILALTHPSVHHLSHGPPTSLPTTLTMLELRSYHCQVYFQTFSEVPWLLFLIFPVKMLFYTIMWHNSPGSEAVMNYLHQTIRLGLMKMVHLEISNMEHKASAWACDHSTLVFKMNVDDGITPCKEWTNKKFFQTKTMNKQMECLHHFIRKTCEEETMNTGGGFSWKTTTLVSPCIPLQAPTDKQSKRSSKCMSGRVMGKWNSLGELLQTEDTNKV